MIICENKRCCGCMVCADVCPQGAVSGIADENGFMRPHIDPELCTECGLCAKKCPVNSKTHSVPVGAYAAYNKNADERKESSSGGVFVLLANDVLKRNGTVCGAGFDSDFCAVHKFADDRDALSELMNSKYVQSNTYGIWKKVKEKLLEGTEVLFSGTPCQCAALLSYLGKRYENLTLVDIICHGVPSPEIWKKYVSENFNGVLSVNFRDKRKGWDNPSITVRSDKGEYSEISAKNPYFRLFLSDTVIREACYDCNFKNDGYVSDITLGDFWGINRLFPEMNDNMGTSAVIVRTEKGQKAIDSIAGDLVMKPCSSENIMTRNSMLSKSAECPANRNEVLKVISENETVEKTAERYAPKASLDAEIKTEIKRRMGRLYGKLKAIKNGRL